MESSASVGKADEAAGASSSLPPPPPRPLEATPAASAMPARKKVKLSAFQGRVGSGGACCAGTAVAVPTSGSALRIGVSMLVLRVLFLARERRPRWLWLPEVGSGDGGAAVGWFLLPASAGDAGFWLRELLLESGEGRPTSTVARGGGHPGVTRRFEPLTRSGCNEPSRRPTPLTSRRADDACTRRVS